MSVENQEMLNQDEGLSLKDLFYIVRKHLLVIIALVFAFTVIGYGYAKVDQKRNPEYQVSSSLLISVDTTSSNLSQNTAYSLSQYLTDTFIVFIKEDVVLEKVLAEKKATYPELTLKKMKNSISASMKGNSLFMVVNYTAESSKEAADILNCITSKAIEIANSVDENNKPVHQFLNNTLSISTAASENKYTAISHTMKYTVIFFAVGAVLAFAYVLLRELFDNRFKNVEEVEKVLGIPVLAGIPDYEISAEGGNK